MPNITTVLKEEIVRLARKEIRNQTSVLKKMSAQYRRDIAEMKRRIAELQCKITPPPETGAPRCVRSTSRGGW